MGLSEKRLLRRVHQFLPPGDRVLEVEVASANPIDAQYRPTPVALTDRGLLLVTATGATGIVTDIPSNAVSEARSEGTVLVVSFRDAGDRPRTVEIDFRRGGETIIEKFLDAVRHVQPNIAVEDDRVPLGSYHVAWEHGRGATFDLFEKKDMRPRYDDGVAGVRASEMCKQAGMELARALADQPDLVWVRPRPEWMPEFVWTPPLPSSEPKRR